MLKFKLQFVTLLPVLLLIVTSGPESVQIQEQMVVPSDHILSIPEVCENVHVTNAGVTCSSVFGAQVSLEFPQVNLTNVLEGDEYLPRASSTTRIDEKATGDNTYRNIVLVLTWEPVTPDFLQIYLNEYLPYWGNRVPYRLLWKVHYEKCAVMNCTEWMAISKSGEFLPSDVRSMPYDMAADADFNGVPVAFWNVNVAP
jgi:hypothetical protein